MNLNRTVLGILLGAMLAGCSDTFFEEEPSNDPVSNFESLWTTFDTRYAVFTERNVDWDELYQTYRPQINHDTGDNALFDIITAMMDSLDDGHVSLMTPGRPFWNAKTLFRTRDGFERFNLFVVLREYLDNQFTQIDNQVWHGVYENEIGYIFLNHLSDPIPIDDILASMPEVKGMIIDLRHNGGGDFTNGEVVASRFADTRRLAFSGQPKNGPGSDDFGEVTEYYLEPAGDRFEGPVVVITSPYTISAGENLTMYLRELPQVTVIGDNTSGAMGERIEREMPNGWIYSITGQVVRAADGISYEGPGLPPEIYFENRLEDVENNIDSLFLTAVNHLRTQF